ncbi:hypothetical protein J9303_16885 [Bacillaceae bacterium Marseille-Q3522]|nr:hypothetical protein [Bacillaceae bacterium Marseille-Q3522]
MTIGQKRYYLFLLSILFLAGCTSLDKMELHSLRKDFIRPLQPFALKRPYIPIKIDDEQFQRIVGWLDNNTIIYVTDKQQQSAVYQYNLLTGKKARLFESKTPIASVYISPSKKQLIIISNYSLDESEFTIINRDGSTKLSRTFSAFDHAVQWNMYDENEVILATFSKDWEATTYLFTINDNQFTEIDGLQPFSYWQSKDTVVYLDWKEENPSLYAPLMKKSINDKNGTVLFPKVYQVITFKNLLLAITVEEGQNRNAIYTFYNDDLQEVSSLQMPLLARISDWLVPYSEYLASDGSFLTFRPYNSTDTFELIKYDVKTKKVEVLAEGLENKPLSCSPDGNSCLYGFTFETIIDLKTKEMIPIVDEKNGG